MYYLNYNRDLKDLSRELRKNPTPGELALWSHLKSGAMYGYTFNRQKPLGQYIVDFYCKPINLVIEVDGPYHFFGEQRILDSDRQSILEEFGLSFLRFREEIVTNDIDPVIECIRNFIVDFENANPNLKLPVRRHLSKY